jgi:hypothetical protein
MALRDLCLVEPRKRIQAAVSSQLRPADKSDFGAGIGDQLSADLRRLKLGKSVVCGSWSGIIDAPRPNLILAGDAEVWP